MRKIMDKNMDKIKILLCSADLFLHQIMVHPFISSKFHLVYKFKNKLVGMIPKKESLNPLGRWNIDYCSKKINNKVDLSNEDHCGPCGQYILSKNIPKSKIIL
jgi:hypothetical protein